MHQVHFSSSSNNPAMKSEFECWLSPPISFKITFDQACSEYTEADFCGLQTFMEHPTITISQRCIKCTSAPAAAVTTSLPWKANLRNLGEEEVKSYTEGFKCWLIKCLPTCIFYDTVTISISHDAFNSPIAWCLPWKVNLSVWAKERSKSFVSQSFVILGGPCIQCMHALQQLQDPCHEKWIWVLGGEEEVKHIPRFTSPRST